MGVKPVSDLEALFSAPSTSHQGLAESGEDASAKLQRLVGGFWIARALHAVAELGIADLLHAGVHRSDELAIATDTHAPSLRHLLRALASVGLFTEEPRDFFALTPLSHKLRTDVPDSLRPFVLAELGEDQYNTEGNILQKIKTEQPLREAASSSLLEQAEPRFCPESFSCNDGLGSVAARVHAAVLDAYDFSTARTLVDVGGGDGAFLSFLLQADTRLRGIVVEQPQAIETARSRLAVEGIHHRCKVVAGDFFEFLPRQGDLYLLKWIISRYADEQAVQILANCRRAMSPTAKLLLIDPVTPVDHFLSLVKRETGTRWTSTHRRARTVDEFRLLLRRAGLRMTRIFATCPEAIMVEAVRERHGAEREAR